MLPYRARPDGLLIYYGYPNSFNSLVNGWNNEKVAQNMAQYDLIVLGNGVANPTHPDYGNSKIIIPRVKKLKPLVHIYGYVSVNQDMAGFHTMVDQWDALEVDGIFMDEAGYDFGKTRADLNARITHIRTKSKAKSCFVNAWNPDHVLGVVNDPSYPNSTLNPDLLQSLLNGEDWLLLESFAVNTSAPALANGYNTESNWLTRGETTAIMRNQYHVKIASVNIINNGNVNGKTLFDFAYNSGIMWLHDAAGSSDTNYGASTAQIKFWPRPTKHIGCTGVPVVVADAADSHILMRYGTNSKAVANFNGTPVIIITNW